ncbi:hypothetical protein TUMEXPCC7403_24300 [Tumidithrix helvetica PCC 7403]|uniref:IPT/TIG domain-containing protein n=1 Tax=Tumidithrix helvetica TaxID=3457545 RepID=UPI003CA9F640
MQNLIISIDHPSIAIKKFALKELAKFGSDAIESLDKLLDLAANNVYLEEDLILIKAFNAANTIITQEDLIKTINAIITEEDKSEVLQKCINLLEGDNPKLLPFKLIKDLNVSPEDKNKLEKALWDSLYKCQKTDFVSNQIFDVIYEITENKDRLIDNIILNNRFLTEQKYGLIFGWIKFRNSSNLSSVLVEKWKSSNEVKEVISNIIIEAINDGDYNTKIKTIGWLQNVLSDNDLPPNLHKQIKQVLSKQAFGSSGSDIQSLAKNALNQLNQLDQIEHPQEYSNQSEDEKKKEVLEIFQTKTFTEQIAYIQNLIEADANERDENLQFIVDLWIQWIVDLDTDKASLVRITADKIRTTTHAVIPLVNQLEQGWQAKDDFKIKIRNKIIESEKNLDCLKPTFGTLLPPAQQKSLEGLREWLSSIKEQPSNYSEQIRSEFDKKQADRQLAEKILEILVKEEIDNFKLQVQKRIARQLADMSDDRFFATASKEYENIKEELRKHAVPALARRLPKESDIEIRESMARVLGNVGGTFAVDALAQAVVGEERTRTARQDLLAKYYLEPSKARSEEAASILKGAVQEAKKTLWMLQGLNVAVFAAGIIMLTGGVFISINGENEAKRVAGGLAGIGGLSGLIVQMVNDPLKRIQNAMSNLIQAETAFTSFIWELNLNGTYIQSQYVAEGIISNEEIDQTVDRIENSMNLTMNLVSEHLNSENQGIFPRLSSLVPPVSEVEKVITIYGQNLKKRDTTNRLVAINHRLIDSEAITSWNENTVKFKLPSKIPSIGTEHGSVWVSLFVDGTESNVLPLQVLRNPSPPTLNLENNDQL